MPELDGGSTSSHAWWRKLLTLPGVALATAMTALVSRAVTQAITTTQSKVQLRNPVSLTIETNPNHVGGFADQDIDMVLPDSADPRTGPGPGCEGFHDWARRNGGVDAGTTKMWRWPLQAMGPAHLQVR
jgi:hypothetical protein